MASVIEQDDNFDIALAPACFGKGEWLEKPSLIMSVQRTQNVPEVRKQIDTPSLSRKRCELLTLVKPGQTQCDLSVEQSL